MEEFPLSKTILFRGTSPEEIKAMEGCLESRRKSYEKGEMIYRMGDVVTELGLVLSGSVLIENDDIWGNRSILDKAEAGQIFAESYACVPGERLMVQVTAAETCKILFVNVRKLLSVCPSSCAHHQRLIQNLLEAAARKNLRLSQRIFQTSPKSIRGRLLAYLSNQAVREGSREFAIPFNRHQLADYLNVDRSALSHELGKMQREGLIQVQRNQFRLLASDVDSCC